MRRRTLPGLAPLLPGQVDNPQLTTSASSSRLHGLSGASMRGSSSDAKTSEASCSCGYSSLPRPPTVAQWPPDVSALANPRTKWPSGGHPHSATAAQSWAGPHRPNQFRTPQQGCGVPAAGRQGQFGNAEQQAQPLLLSPGKGRNDNHPNPAKEGPLEESEGVMLTQTKAFERAVQIPAGRRKLNGILTVPPAAGGVVAFAHGSGSGRFSPRNQFVARVLQQAGLATLLLDLLEEDEAEDRRKVFDIELLAERLRNAADWLKKEPATRALRLGYFGASTGAGAALVAAARTPEAVGAIVSRGGRPDLAGDYLSAVGAPTLLIVGGDDDVVIDLNQEAFRFLHCPKELVIVPGATHLFEEPGTLEEVARLAKDWFVRHLTSRGSPSP